MKHFDTFGVMIDMSRNAVMTLDSLKRFLPLLKKMGYNCLMLYTEDTYEVNGEPYFGYMRGRYTKEELKEIDAYAHAIGMDVIPCVQTLAHLNAATLWNKLPFDCNDILLVDDERTYEFIDRMFATLSECFVSKRIHIGMDEAHMVGRGKHCDIYGYERKFDIMIRHLNRVREIAKKYDFELLIWSDMFFRYWNDGVARIPRAKIPQEIIDAFPTDVTPVYWDYYQTEEDSYAGMLENHAQFSKKMWFAGGIWSWRGWAPFNQFSIDSMVPAINACKKHHVRNVIMTLWGDNGAECSHFSQLPALYYVAQYAKGITDEEQIKAEFYRLVGIDFDEFMKLDRPNYVVPFTGRPRNPSKYMLYSDYFNDFLDYTVKPGAGAQYKDYAKDLHATARKSRRYGYVFETVARLCDVMAVKYELGLRTRRAYEAGDKDELRLMANEDYLYVLRKTEAFLKAFERQWYLENKPSGFDVQHKRLGGLLLRTKACRARILDYVNGRVDAIPELEEKLLPFGKCEESIDVFDIEKYMTPNVLG